MFADFFKSVYNDDRQSCDPEAVRSLSQYEINLPRLLLSDNDILNERSAFGASKGPGPDDLPPVFVKGCANSLASPITTLYKRSLQEGTYSQEWEPA